MTEKEAIKLAPINSCTGCMACGDVCPKGCIAFSIGKDGFWYPLINHDICIKCHSCEQACPIINSKKKEKTTPKAYAVWASKEVRNNSASGGAYYALASQVIKDGGYVAGAVFDGYRVKHILTNKVEELERIQGTKYFQSNTSGVYKEIKRLLCEGVKVLFSGTSCQVAGLLNVVGKEYNNLITVDLICFGVPSSLTVGAEEKVRGKRLKRIVSNRDKNHEGGWRNAYYMTCEWDDGSITISSPKQSFMLGSFCSGKVMRESCYHCPFKTIERESDITIGDYHCIKDFEEEKTDGISLVFVHTEKGEKELLGNPYLTIHERDIKECLPFKRTIYHNDSIYGKRVVRRWMPFFLKHAPNWLLKVIYQDIVKSKNPLVWPLTAIDAIYLIANNWKANKELNRIKTKSEI